ncbi:unnamed protein product [Leptosia nina]|uniref:Zinc carboxypeptidase A 1 n=1 Tax=Leptosia nina TaxID=320188 RepID=A0AAV1JL39_9NEOP
MLLKIVFVSVLGLVIAEKVRYDNFALYKIYPNTKEHVEFLKDLYEESDGLDFWIPPVRVGEYVNVVSSPERQMEFEHSMKKRSLNYDVMLQDIQQALDDQIMFRKKRDTRREMFWTNYQTLEDIYNWFYYLAETHSDIVSIIQAGTSFEGRNITGVKIARNSGRKIFLIEGGQIAADWLSPTVITYLVDQLVRGEDPEALAASRDYEWHIFPMINPDGHEYTNNAIRLWRKNRRPISGSAVGVDLTKNWNSQWGAMGGSFSAVDQTFVGLGPFSEPETRSFSSYIESISSNLVGMLSFRGYGQRFILPFAHTSDPMYNYQDMIKIGRRAMGSLAVKYDTQYRVGVSRDVFDGATGMLADWVKFRFNPPIVATYALRDTGTWGYTLPIKQVLPSCEETFDSIMAVIREAKLINVLHLVIILLFLLPFGSQTETELTDLESLNTAEQLNLMFSDAPGLVSAKFRYDGYTLYKILPENDKHINLLQELQNDTRYDFWTEPAPGSEFVNVMSSPGHKNEFEDLLNRNGVKFTISMTNVQEAIDKENIGTYVSRDLRSMRWDTYYTLGQINTWLDDLVARHSNVASIIVGGQSYEGRPIRGVKISHGSGKRAIFIESGIHAREWITMATTNYIIDQLLRSTNTEVRGIAREFDWYIFPVTNPDGYVWSHDYARTWRKNRRPIGTEFGVDLNRNWNSNWLAHGSSTNPALDNYAGPGPFSEIETRTLSEYIRSLSDKIDLYLSMHSFSQLLLVPFGNSTQAYGNYHDAVNIGRRAMGALSVRYGTQYTTGSIAEAIYLATGGSIDWVKSALNIPLVYCYEFRDRGQYGFLLPGNQIIPNSEEVLDSIVDLIFQAKRFQYLNNSNRVLSFMGACLKLRTHYVDLVVIVRASEAMAYLRKLEIQWS